MLDTAPDLKPLSCKQLRELIGEAQQQLQERTQEEMEDARQQLQLLADQIGVTPEEIVGGTRRPPARKKYTDGNGNYWTGKGRTPTWLQEKLDEGAQLDDFLTQS